MHCCSIECVRARLCIPLDRRLLTCVGRVFGMGMGHIWSAKRIRHRSASGETHWPRRAPPHTARGRLEIEKEAYDTGYSQAVTHPSTNPARPGLTSVIGREPVYSRWYGRRRKTRRQISEPIAKNGAPSCEPAVRTAAGSLGQRELPHEG